tara:strand:- start:3641 stop:3925 length:285 start_codon:yes stop_codon:yes gene_type:complete
MDNFNTHEWNKNRYLNRIDENKEFLEDLAGRLSSKFDNLDFNVKFGERIDVKGSQQDLGNFGDKYDGQKYQGYEVFSTEEEDRGNIVRIIKSKK